MYGTVVHCLIELAGNVSICIGSGKAHQFVTGKNFKYTGWLHTNCFDPRGAEDASVTASTSVEPACRHAKSDG
jgi:hypothetical protein